jgi:hypothetical protein
MYALGEVLAILLNILAMDLLIRLHVVEHCPMLKCHGRSVRNSISDMLVCGYLAPNSSLLPGVAAHFAFPLISVKSSFG